jgi:pilus assembly protein CpaC
MSRRRALVLLVALFAVAMLLPRPAAAAPQSVSVGTGLTVNVRVGRAIDTVQVLNPRVANVVRAHGRIVTLVGMSAGVTELHVWTVRGRLLKIRVKVTRAATSQLYQNVRAFLGPVAGLTVRMIGNLVIIEGRALTLADYGRVVRARRIFGKDVINLAGYHPLAVRELNRLLQRAGLSAVRARAHGGHLFLSGSVGSPTELRKARALVAAAVMATHALPGKQ